MRFRQKSRMNKSRVLMYNLFNSYKLIEKISYGNTDCPRQRDVTINEYSR